MSHLTVIELNWTELDWNGQTYGQTYGQRECVCVLKSSKEDLLPSNYVCASVYYDDRKAIHSREREKERKKQIKTHTLDSDWRWKKIINFQ